MHPPFVFAKKKTAAAGSDTSGPGGGQRTVVVTESPQEPRRAASDHCQPPPPRAPSACRTAAGDNRMSPPRLRVYRRARQQGLCVIDSTSFMHMQHAVNYPQMPLLAALLDTPPRLFGRISFGRSTRFSPTHFRQRRKSVLSRPCREENSAGALPALPALPQTEQRMLRSRRSSPAEARSELLLAVVGTSPSLAIMASCWADAAMEPHF